MTIASVDSTTRKSLSGRDWLTLPAWAWFGLCAFALVLAAGSRALLDSDTQWQIVVGQEILSRHAFPHTDIYSFSKAGEPWISSSWLSQVIFAVSYDLAGWAGPVVLTALGVGVTFGLLTYILSQRFSVTHAVIVAMIAALLAMGHYLARPHILAMPVMLAWGYGLISASGKGRAPSFWLLPLMVLWTNLHGSFVLGIALTAPFALDALWNADASQRKSLALRWFAFGVASLAASCVTPYGWGSLLAAKNILSLGQAMSFIPEWQPADFSDVKLFEACVLVGTVGLLVRGLQLSPPRIVLVIGLLYMALSHTRNYEVFALFMPLVVADPLSVQWRTVPSTQPTLDFQRVAFGVVVMCIATFALTFGRTFSPPDEWSPVAAIKILKDRDAKRVLNSPGFGGYMIRQHMPVFVDGRAELYGERFVVDMFHAFRLTQPEKFVELLNTYKIDATLLAPSVPAVTLLDHLPGWKRIYADDKAVIHVRSDSPDDTGTKFTLR